MSPAAPTVSGLPVVALGGAVFALALLALQRPPMTRRTALAAAPWAVAGGLVHVLGATGGYPADLRPLTEPLPLALLTGAIAVLVWAPLVVLGRLRDLPGDPARYLAGGGAGAAVVLSVVLVLRGLPLTPAAVLWLTVTPVLAGVFAGIGYFLLGLRVVDALAYTRFAGLLAVFGQTLDALAIAVARLVFDAPTPRPIEGPVLVALRELPVPAPVGLVALKLLVGLLVVAAVSGGAREDRWWAFIALALVGAAGLGSGVATLLLAALG